MKPEQQKFLREQAKRRTKAGPRIARVETTDRPLADLLAAPPKDLGKALPKLTDEELKRLGHMERIGPDRPAVVAAIADERRKREVVAEQADAGEETKSTDPKGAEKSEAKGAGKGKGA